MLTQPQSRDYCTPCCTLLHPAQTSRLVIALELVPMASHWATPTHPVAGTHPKEALGSVRRGRGRPGNGREGRGGIPSRYLDYLTYLREAAHFTACCMQYCVLCSTSVGRYFTQVPSGPVWLLTANHHCPWASLGGLGKAEQGREAMSFRCWSL